MRWSEFVATYSSGYPYRFRHFLSEVEELIEAICDRSWSGIVEEFGDTIMTFQLWLGWFLGMDFQMVLPSYVYDKFDARMEGWRKVFAAEGLEFRNKYLVSGGNYKRKHKREAALRMARAEQ